MEFKWDEKKRVSNLEQHYLDFRDAIDVFGNPYLQAPATTVRGEVRGMAIGMLDDLCVASIFTRRDSVTRLISMRKARYSKRERYEKAVVD